MTKVEEGKSIEIIKSGKPIAILYPLSARSQGWKRKIKKIKLKGDVTAQFLIEMERKA